MGRRMSEEEGGRSLPNLGRQSRAHAVLILRPHFAQVAVMGKSRTYVFVLVLAHFAPDGH
jgi:hypothetical protein